MKNTLGFALAVAGLIAANLAIGTFGQDPPQPAKMYIYSGTLRSMDQQARTITVEASSLSQKFIVPTLVDKVRQLVYDRYQNIC